MSTIDHPDELVTTHVALVHQIARGLALRLPRYLDTDDLIGAGCLALVQAARSFDPDHQVPFERFAAVRVKGAMIDCMRRRDWATRAIRSDARAVATAIASLEQQLQRTPTNSEVAEAAHISLSQLADIRIAADRAALVSLDAANEHDAGELDAADSHWLRPEETLLAAEQLGYLRDAIRELPARVQQVIVRYYLDGTSLTDIAHDLGITASRASQLRSEGVKLLHEMLTALLDDQPIATAEPALDEFWNDIDSASTHGQRPRRRQAYQQAVAHRSSVRGRADINA